ncbi:unnamed protein product [Rhizoctonia solani]|uniref:Uncharacterized protein n=1 Tax=Rhizoctonia solani TaxID=456999 RepID=A0A8H3CWH5_9AGAM|nr:unnamed protein product [Rhizoctonia solani]
MNPHTNPEFARYRSKLLGLAALSSFISANWAAANLFSFSNYVWTPLGSIGNPAPALGFDAHEIHIHVGEGDLYTCPIIILAYLTFFLVFIPKVIFEWRLEVRIPLCIEYAYVGMAYRTNDSKAAILLENLANSDRTMFSNWGFINLMSIISLVALTAHLTLPVISDIWRILYFMRRVRHVHLPDTPFQEPLLPAYSAQPIENLEARVLEGRETVPKDCV